MTKLIFAVVAAALLSCALVAPAIERAAAAEPRALWSEVSWPFPIDQWGKGKAFVCKAADCGTHVAIYLRAKIGFCNCSTGVADDEELDRISDFDLLGNQLTAQGPGRPIAVAWMKGRSRPFSIGGAQRAGRSALSIGFNDRCDAIIATVVVGHGQPAAIEAAVLDFLNSRTVLRWAEVTPRARAQLSWPISVRNLRHEPASRTLLVCRHAKTCISSPKNLLHIRRESGHRLCRRVCGYRPALRPASTQRWRWSQVWRREQTGARCKHWAPPAFDFSALTIHAHSRKALP